MIVLENCPLSQNRDMISLNPEPAKRPNSAYYLTNAKTMNVTNFAWSFHAIWKGDIDYGPPVRLFTPVPEGRCHFIKGSHVTGNDSYISPSCLCNGSL
ncbi:hypothetical protein DPMN_175274 [Dreissena polymorpha]|uniref:Uncharacterized protein n=1 Tax=Dreissena polymorpha TaxID=45954 RepID=A0A9D4E690_DREPO|nr:hypothetical protein DPMN_175274 [Dreissena polymorpha]